MLNRYKSTEFGSGAGLNSGRRRWLAGEVLQEGGAGIMNGVSTQLNMGGDGGPREVSADPAGGKHSGHPYLEATVDFNEKY